MCSKQGLARTIFTWQVDGGTLSLGSKDPAKDLLATTIMSRSAATGL
jgi:hypothetical protein